MAQCRPGSGRQWDIGQRRRTQRATVIAGAMPKLLREPGRRLARLVVPPLRVSLARTAARANPPCGRWGRGARMDAVGDPRDAADRAAAVVVRGGLPVVLPESQLQRRSPGGVSGAGRPDLRLVSAGLFGPRPGMD